MSWKDFFGEADNLLIIAGVLLLCVMSFFFLGEAAKEVILTLGGALVGYLGKSAVKVGNADPQP